MSKILTFKNGYSIEVYDKSTIHNIVIIFANPEDAIKAWEQFTVENMEYCIFDNMEYYNIVPLDLDLIKDDNGIVIARFESRNKTEIELIKDQIRDCLYC